MTCFEHCSCSISKSLLAPVGFAHSLKTIVTMPGRKRPAPDPDQSWQDLLPPLDNDGNRKQGCLCCSSLVSDPDPLDESRPITWSHYYTKKCKGDRVTDTSKPKGDFCVYCERGVRFVNGGYFHYRREHIPCMQWIHRHLQEISDFRVQYIQRMKAQRFNPGSLRPKYDGTPDSVEWA